MQKVLVGYDGSESSRLALDFAVEFAGKYGSQLHVVAVIRPPEFGGDVETEAVIERSREYFSGLLDQVRARLAGGPLRCTFQVLVGHPSEQIVRYAEANGIDHIVVGHRGRSRFERWLIGSVARQVVSYAQCTVTIVRR